MKPNIQIQTFGCKLNHYDSLVMTRQLKDLDPDRQIFILNSCAVTAQAGKDIRKKADKIKRERPDSLIALTGCGAQTETELYKKSKSIDLVIGNSERKNLKRILESYSADREKKVFKSNIFKSSSIYSDFISLDPERTRAFLKIQDGCDSFCSFCVIPFARGLSKSLSMDFLARSIQKLEAEGAREAVLTGVHIGDYKDGDRGLSDLLAYLLEKTSLPRIRLSSLEPIEITDKLLDCFSDERLCPHFHVSLQSASSSVLKAMKRRYSQKGAETAFQKIAKKSPKAFVGMDVIAGFPSESKKDFEESYNFLKDQPWTNMHVFPYSSRKGTYSAFKWPDLPQKEVSLRARRLRGLSAKRFESHIERQKGSRKKVLLFKKDPSKGLSRDYWKVQLPPSSRKGEQEAFIEGRGEKPGWLKARFLIS